MRPILSMLLHAFALLPHVLRELPGYLQLHDRASQRSPAVPLLRQLRNLHNGYAAVRLSSRIRDRRSLFLAVELVSARMEHLSPRACAAALIVWRESWSEV